MQYYTIPGITKFAEAYGVGSYSGCAYSESCSTSTGTDKNPLTDTGVMIGLFVGIACLLLLVVVLVRFWRRASREAEPVLVSAEDDSRPDEKNNRED